MPLPIFGEGKPGERVIVRMAGHEAQAEVDGRGYWILRLPPLASGGPHKLQAESASGQVEIEDLLVGDVWLCSGQSNMEWSLRQCGQQLEEDATEFPQIRLLTAKTPVGWGQPVSMEGCWVPCTAESLSNFSAVGGYFGRELHRTLKVPIGLICNARGGTRIQAWMSRECLVRDPSGREEVQFYESFRWQVTSKLRNKTFAEWEQADAPKDPGNLGLELGWASADFNDTAWPLMQLPGSWQDHGHAYNGIFWFRRTELVPHSWVGKDLTLSLGAIDKHDEVWVNGKSVGATGWETPDAWCKPRVYFVPSRLVGPKRQVVIAIRVRSHVYHGGIMGPGQLMHLGLSNDSRLPLCGNWHYTIERNWGNVEPPALEWGPGNPNSPHILFDNSVAPLVPYGLRGVAWYQGEANVHEAVLYRRLLPSMIRDWRRAWGQGDFPFLQVQLAGFGEPSQRPGMSRWAELRESQFAALAEPATGMAVAIDLGEANNIHPSNKRDVGLRLADCALAEAYEHNGPSSGPIFSRINIEANGRVRCSFRHVGNGLVARGGRLRHFALAGKDRIFLYAEAVIEGRTVVVHSSEIPEPVAVRYAWADNPEGCNLYNSEGFPAAPFRSDSWTT
jgi:sialate O-acetylesterase